MSSGAGYSSYDEHWVELGRCIAEVPPGEYRCSDAGIFRTDDGSALPVNSDAAARLAQLRASAKGTTRTGLIADTGGDRDPHTRFYWVVEELK